MIVATEHRRLANEASGGYNYRCVLDQHLAHKAGLYSPHGFRWFFGQQQGPRALRQLTAYAGDVLGLTHLKSGSLEHNTKSIKVLQKNGFKVTDIIINRGEYNDKFAGESIWKMELVL